MYRQGDVLVMPVDRIPKKDIQEIMPKDGRFVLAEGEATGHVHAIPSEHAQLYQVGVAMYLMLAKAAELVHEEHGKIDLPPGNYQVIQQREYSPEAIRNVRD